MLFVVFCVAMACKEDEIEYQNVLLLIKQLADTLTDNALAQVLTSTWLKSSAYSCAEARSCYIVDRDSLRNSKSLS